MNEPSITTDIDVDPIQIEPDFDLHVEDDLDAEILYGSKPSRPTSDSKSLDDWTRKKSMFSSTVKTAFAGFWIAVMLICSFGLPSISTDEADHPNWKHITKVESHNADLQAQGLPNQLMNLQHGQGLAWVDGVAIAREDLDTVTTKEVREAVLAGDYEQAASLLKDAQRIDPKHETDYEPPILTQGMADGLARGEKDLYHLYLYDCCAQDGDVVRIELNGEPFATIPLTHTGVTLSVPVGTGTTIGLYGVRDGGGGITVSCRTSQGDHFTSALAPGQVKTIAIVR